jgi:hypothetical protein
MRCLKNAWPTRFTSGTPPARPDRLRHRPAGTHVVEDLPARLLLEDRLAEQRGDEVAGTNSPLSSTKKQRSASPSNATPRSAVLFDHLVDDELTVLREQRVRLVVRERTVRLEVAAHRLDRQVLEHRREHHAGHPVRGVDDNAERRLTASRR